MWGKLKTLLLLLSVALNLPFIALWAASTIHPRESRAAESVSREPQPREPSPGVPSAPRGPSPRGFGPVRPEGTRSVYRDVGVTEEQWHEIEPRLAQFRTAMFRLGREMKRQRDELVELIAAPELDVEAVRAKQEAIVAAHRRMGELVTENMIADREVLTPDQQSKFFAKLRDYCGPSPTSPMPSNRPSSPVFGAPAGSRWGRTKETK